MKKITIIFLILQSLSASLVAQSGQIFLIKTSVIDLPQRRTAIIKQIEQFAGIIVSYSSTQFEDEVIETLPADEVDLQSLLTHIFQGYNVELTPLGENKFVLNVRELRISISGYIMDDNSGEVLPGVIVYQPNTGKFTTTDTKGFYFMECKPGKIYLEIQILGYEPIRYEAFQQKSFIRNHRLSIVPNTLPPVIIYEKQILDPLTEIVPRSDNLARNTVLGDKDPLNMLKTIPGVTPGGEGQMGLNIRGTGSDQNLILLEGMPLYESYHTGGLSSIFMDEAIRSIDFMKNGQPARYGGRLSSIVNVMLKDGHKDSRETTISPGLQGITFFTQGPVLKNKLTYALSIRNSWINTLLKPVKKNISLYDDLFLRYRDLQVKLNYKWSDTKKLSAAIYTGSDRLSLGKNSYDETGVLQSNQLNKFSSGNTLVSLNYDQVIRNRLKLSMQAGLLSYNVFSRGSYVYPVAPQDTASGSLDIINNSQIADRQITSAVDYYYNDNVKISAGIGYIHHALNPAIKQSLSIVDGINEGFGNEDSAYVASETFGFLEWNLRLKNKLYCIPGVYQVHYRQNGFNTWSTQPRLQLQYLPSEKLTLNASYSRSVQYIHLLANSGLGLPSELWVPATSKVNAQTSDHYSFDLRYEPDSGYVISASVYTRSFDRLTEYNEAVDFFINLFPPRGTPPIVSSERDWENKVVSGNGKASGFECAFRAEGKKIQYWLGYHFGRSYRSFDQLNEGERFVSRFDKPHQFSAGINYRPTAQWNIAASFVYTSGQPFTIADEQFTFYDGLDTIGVTLVQTGKKNNYRMPAFHQLSFNASYAFTFTGIKSTLSFGVYNVYNRLNAYFIYATRNGDDSTLFKKVSLFPILPQLSFTFTW
ncbi:MAG: TonB-dependent receptor plug domain-containing protein [Saprospiraceae bacterium]|nr:TonB-dependent receptor plug domain-containing protein [Saprospiraceae bacterium]